MKIVFVRHGEPDYATDSLTENGKIEAELLSERIKNWPVTQFYVSPLGRAKATADYTLKKVNKEAKELSFMREFSYPIIDPITDRHGVCWDFVPSDWTKYPCMFEQGDAFINYPCISTNDIIKENYPKVINGFDDLLKEYGYVRDGYFYRIPDGPERFISSTVSPDGQIRNNHLPKEGEEEPLIVIFCHLGVICLVLSHLLNIPFELLTHGFFMPTTSITVLSTEERWSNEAYFRVQTIGDVHHLLSNNHLISPAGSFANPFQG